MLSVYRNVVRAPFELAGEMISALLFLVTVVYVRARMLAGVVNVRSN